MKLITMDDLDQLMSESESNYTKPLMSKAKSKRKLITMDDLDQLMSDSVSDAFSQEPDYFSKTNDVIEDNQDTRSIFETMPWRDLRKEQLDRELEKLGDPGEVITFKPAPTPKIDSPFDSSAWAEKYGTISQAGNPEQDKKMYEAGREEQQTNWNKVPFFSDVIDAGTDFMKMGARGAVNTLWRSPGVRELRQDITGVYPSENQNLWDESPYDRGVRESAQEARSNMGAVEGFYTDVKQGIGSSLPTILSGGGLGGLALMGAAAGGMNAQRALDEGATATEAGAFGVTTGAAEAATEKLFGFIPGGKFFEEELAGLTGIATKNAKKIINNFIKKSAGEGFEEFIMDPITGISEKYTFKPDKAWTGEDGVFDPKKMAYDFAVGMSAGMLMGSPMLPSGFQQAKKAQSEIGNNFSTDVRVGLGMPQDMQSFKMAQDIGIRGEGVTIEEYEQFVDQLRRDMPVYNQRILSQQGQESFKLQSNAGQGQQSFYRKGQSSLIPQAPQENQLLAQQELIAPQATPQEPQATPQATPQEPQVTPQVAPQEPRAIEIPSPQEEGIYQFAPEDTQQPQEQEPLSQTQNVSIENFDTEISGDVTKMIPPENKPVEKPPQDFTYSKDDIPYNLAKNAYRAISFDPERRATSEQESYVRDMERIETRFKEVAKTPEQKEIMIDELNKYKSKYIEYAKKVLNAKSKTMSSMITGPSNFPVARNRKALDYEHKVTREFIDWSEKALKAMEKKIKGSVTAEARTNETTERLKQEVLDVVGTLKSIENGAPYSPALFRSSLQNKLKRAVDNGHIEAVKDALEHLKEVEKKAGLKKPVFAPNNMIWEYVNKKAEVTPAEEIKVTPAGQEIIADTEQVQIIKNNSLDRIQIVFDGKPSGEIIKDLKGAGWNWSPSNKAWQRKLTPNAEYSAKNIVEKHYPTEKETKAETTKAMPEKESPIENVTKTEYNENKGDITDELIKTHPEYNESEEGRKDLETATEAIRDLQKLEGARTEEGASLPDNAGKTDGVPKYRTITTGNALSVKAIQTGKIELKGAKVSSVHDLAEIAQVFRDPRFETMRYIFVKNNIVVHTEAVSSCITGMCAINPYAKAASEYQKMSDESKLPKLYHSKQDYKKWTDELNDIIRKYEADGYYLLHNHPGGKVEATQTDIDATENIQKDVPGFLSHLIIDSNKYFVITKSGDDAYDGKVVEKKFHEIDKLFVAAKEHPLLGKQITGISSLGNIALGMKRQRDKFSTLIHVSTQHKVVGIQEVPNAMITDSQALKEFMKPLNKKFGLSKSFIVTNDENIYKELDPTLITDGFMIDVAYVDKNGKIFKSFRQDNPVDEKDDFWMGKHQGEYPGRKVKEQTERYNKRPFYSKLQQVIDDKMPNRASPDLIYNLISKHGVKTEEVKWSGLNDFLKGKERVDKKELLEFLRMNELQIEEIYKGESKNKEIRLTNWESLVLNDSADNMNNLEKSLIKDGWLDDDGALVLSDVDTGEDLRKVFWNKYDSVFSDRIWDYDNVEPTKYASYQLPGGENYRELLFQLPVKRKKYIIPENAKWIERDGKVALVMLDSNGKYHHHISNWKDSKDEAIQEIEQGAYDYGNTLGAYKSSHWDEPNILAHVRINDRTDAQGNKVLFAEEIQSDWHQEGRKEGYKSQEAQRIEKEIKEKEIKDLDEEDYKLFELQLLNTSNISKEKNKNEYLENLKNQYLREREEIKNKREALLNELRNYPKKVVPDAPFRKYQEFALKRLIRYAAENGYDKIAWTTGDMQNERYNVRKHIKEIAYWKDGEQIGISVSDLRGNPIIDQDYYMPDKLEAVFGREIADKIINDEGVDDPIDFPDDEQARASGVKYISGDNLTVGGQKFKDNYDKIIPNFLNQYGKPWKAKVTELVIGKDLRDTSAYKQGGEAEIMRIAKANKTPDVYVVQSFPITESMKKSVMEEGQPLFEDEAKYDTGREKNKPKKDLPDTVEDLVKRIDVIKEEIEGFKKDGDIESLNDSLKLLSDAEKKLRRAREISKVYSNTLTKINEYEEAERKLFRITDGEYDKRSEVESVQKAQAWLLKDFDGEVRRLTENGITSGIDTDIAMGILAVYRDEGRQTGDYSKMTEWAKLIPVSGVTEAGRIGQAFAKYSRDSLAKYSRTPEDYVRKQAKELQKVEGEVIKKTPEVIETINQETKVVNKILDEADKKAGVETTKEVAKDEERAKEQKTTETTDEENPAEILANKIKRAVKGPKTKEKDIVMQMVNELYSKFRETDKGDKLPKKLKPDKVAEFIEAIGNKDVSDKVWIKAQEILREHFKGNQNALDMIEDYLGTETTKGKGTRPPFSEKTAEAAIKAVMKKLGYKISDMVKDYYATGAQQRVDILEYLKTDARLMELSEDEMNVLANYVDAKFKDWKKKFADEYLKMVYENKKKSSADIEASTLKDIDSLINTGVFLNKNYSDRVNEKLEPKIKTLLRTNKINIHELVKRGENATVFARTNFISNLQSKLRISEEDANKVANIAERVFNIEIEKARYKIRKIGTKAINKSNEIKFFNFFNAKVTDSVIRKVISKLEYKLSDIVKDYYATGAQQRVNIVEYMKTEGRLQNLTENEINRLSDYVSSRLQAWKKDYSENYLKNMYKERPSTPADKEASAIKFIDAAVNSGIFVNLNYSNKVEARIDPKIRTLIRASGIKLHELAKKGKNVTEFEKDTFVENLKGKVRISEEDAQRVAKIAERVFNEELEKARDTILKNMFAVHDPAKRKKMRDKVLELINLGAYSKATIRDLIKAKEDLPVLENEDVEYIMDALETMEMVEPDSYMYRLLDERIELRMANKIEVATRDRVKGLIRVSLLFLKTGIRNIAGNVILTGAENVKDLVGAPIDLIAGKIRGSERTTLFNPIEKLQWQTKGFFKGTKNSYLDLRNSFDREFTNDMSIKQIYNNLISFQLINTEYKGERYNIRKGRIFNNNALNFVDQSVRAMLKFGDVNFYEAAYEMRKNELMKIKGVDTTDNDIEVLARMFALERVFQNDSTLSKKLVAIVRELEVVGDILVPFTQTPANIYDKLLDYSPIGLAKALYELGKTSKNRRVRKIIKGEFDQKVFVDRIARSMTGGIIAILGAAMAALGLASGGDDKREKVRMAGKKSFQAYSFKIGDTWYSYEQLQPISGVLAMGVEYHNKSKDKATMMAKLVAGFDGSGTTIVRMSMLRNAIDVISAAGGPNGSVNGVLAKFFKGAAGQTNPTAIRSLSDLTDDYVRENYDPNPMKQFVKQYISKIPYLSKTLPQRVDVWGDYIKRYDGANNVLNVMFNPIFIKNVKMNPVQKEIMNVFANTNDPGVLPSVEDDVIAFTLDSENYRFTLSVEEYISYQKLSGKLLVGIGEEFIETEEYKALTGDKVEYEVKSKLWSDAVRDAHDAARLSIIQDHYGFTDEQMQAFK